MGLHCKIYQSVDNIDVDSLWTYESGSYVGIVFLSEYVPGIVQVATWLLYRGAAVLSVSSDTTVIWHNAGTDTTDTRHNYGKQTPSTNT